MNIQKTLIAFASVTLLFSCGGGSKQPRQQTAVTPSHYPTTVLTKQQIELAVTYPANIKGQEDIEIRPRIDGFIEEIYIDEGSVVKKGQKLFKINSPQAIQNQASAKATVTSAQAQLSTAKLDVDRITSLVEKNIVSQVQLDGYINKYEAAKAALAQAEAVLDQANAMLSWAIVTSPVDGIAGSIPFRIGSLVNSANALTTVANISNVYAYFSMNEKELLEILETVPGTTQEEKIKNMPPVILRLANNSIYSEKGHIKTISGVVNALTGSVNFRAEFPNPGGLLRSGTSGVISIPQPMDDVLLVPQKSTFSQQDKVMVYKVQGDSVVQALITVVPTSDGQSYAVTGGLSEGDRIVTDGVATLSSGKKIKVD